jgi:RNA polymerase sigma-70 factor (ECF subfamily)
MARPPALRLVRSPEASRPDGSGTPSIGPSAPPDPLAVDDAQLLAAIQSGDEHAAAELHDRLRPRVDMTIRALLGAGHAEHDDLAQQSFVELVLSLARYRGECSLETWAATITARTVFKFLRRKTTERRIFQPTDLAESEPPSSVGLGRSLVARDLAARVRVHLDAMDDAKAEAFVLHDVCGFNAREVAGIAGISEAAAHARIARGRAELHAKIAADPELRDALTGLPENR